ncbi:unnamed protein product, partial [Gulo gulo]
PLPTRSPSFSFPPYPLSPVSFHRHPLSLSPSPYPFVNSTPTSVHLHAPHQPPPSSPSLLFLFFLSRTGLRGGGHPLPWFRGSTRECRGVVEADGQFCRVGLREKLPWAE